jgi:hypothetical protein
MMWFCYINLFLSKININSNIFKLKSFINCILNILEPVEYVSYRSNPTLLNDHVYNQDSIDDNVVTKIKYMKFYS